MSGFNFIKPIQSGFNFLSSPSTENQSSSSSEIKSQDINVHVLDPPIVETNSKGIVLEKSSQQKVIRKKKKSTRIGFGRQNDNNEGDGDGDFTVEDHTTIATKAMMSIDKVDTENIQNENHHSEVVVVEEEEGNKIKELYPTISEEGRYLLNDTITSPPNIDHNALLPSSSLSTSLPTTTTSSSSSLLNNTSGNTNFNERNSNYSTTDMTTISVGASIHESVTAAFSSSSSSSNVHVPTTTTTDTNTNTTNTTDITAINAISSRKMNIDHDNSISSSSSSSLLVSNNQHIENSSTMRSTVDKEITTATTTVAAAAVMINPEIDISPIKSVTESSVIQSTSTITTNEIKSNNHYSNIKNDESHIITSHESHYTQGNTENHYDDDNKELSHIIHSFQHQIHDIQHQYSKHQDKIQALTTDIDRLRSDINTMKIQISHLEKEQEICIQREDFEHADVIESTLQSYKQNIVTTLQLIDQYEIDRKQYMHQTTSHYYYHSCETLLSDMMQQYATLQQKEIQEIHNLQVAIQQERDLIERQKIQPELDRVVLEKSSIERELVSLREEQDGIDTLIREQSSELYSDYETMASTMMTLDAEIEELERLLTQKREQKMSLEKSMNSIQGQLQETRKKYDRQLNRIADRLALVSTAQAECQKEEDEIRAIYETMERKRLHLIENQTQKEVYVTKLNGCTQISQLLQEYYNRHSQRMKEDEMGDSGSTSLSADIEALEHKIHEMNTTMTTLLQLIQSNTEQVNGLKQDNVEKTDRVNTMEIEKKNHANNKRFKEASVLLKEIKELQSMIELNTNKILELNNAISKANQELSEILVEKDTLTVQLQERQLDWTKQQVKNTVYEIYELKQLSERISTESTRLQVPLTAYTVYQEVITIRIQDLEKMVIKMSDEYKLEGYIDVCQQEILHDKNKRMKNTVETEEMRQGEGEGDVVNKEAGTKDTIIDNNDDDNDDGITQVSQTSNENATTTDEELQSCTPIIAIDKDKIYGESTLVANTSQTAETESTAISTSTDHHIVKGDITTTTTTQVSINSYNNKNEEEKEQVLTHLMEISLLIQQKEAQIIEVCLQEEYDTAELIQQEISLLSQEIKEKLKNIGMSNEEWCIYRDQHVPLSASSTDTDANTCI